MRIMKTFARNSPVCRTHAKFITLKLYEIRPPDIVLKTFARISSNMTQEIYTVRITAIEYGIKYRLS